MLLSIALLSGLSACGDSSDDTLDSLPMLTVVTSTTAAPAVGATTTLPTVGEEFYLVQQGDSLSAIAGSFGVKLEALMAANGITDPDKIQAGQKLIIPSGAAPTTTTTSTPEPPTTAAP